MTRKDLRNSAATGPTLQWKYDITKDGQSTDETCKVTLSEAARDFTWLAKQRWAEEQRTKAREARHEIKRLSPDEKSRIAEELKEWLRGPIALTRTEHSIAHRIIPKDLPIEAHILLVQHDWAAVLDQSKIEGPEDHAPRLPYEVTIFEFMFVGGVRAIVITFDPFKGIDADDRATTMLKTKSGWVRLGMLRNLDNVIQTNALVKAKELISRNISAVCAMLEAEVATITPFREPYRRNEPPGPKAQLPIYSSHIVSLARRPRVAPPDEHHEGTRKRLHFRRGHWRHYATHRTWIKWMLVGNPDLGFVDKEYRL